MQNLKISMSVEERGELKSKYTPLNFLFFLLLPRQHLYISICVFIFIEHIMYIQENKCLGIRSYI